MKRRSFLKGMTALTASFLLNPFESLSAKGVESIISRQKRKKDILAEKKQILKQLEEKNLSESYYNYLSQVLLETKQELNLINSGKYISRERLVNSEKLKQKIGEFLVEEIKKNDPELKKYSTLDLEKIKNFSDYDLMVKIAGEELGFRKDRNRPENIIASVMLSEERVTDPQKMIIAAMNAQCLINRYQMLYEKEEIISEEEKQMQRSQAGYKLRRLCWGNKLDHHGPQTEGQGRQFATNINPFSLEDLDSVEIAKGEKFSDEFKEKIKKQRMYVRMVAHFMWQGKLDAYTNFGQTHFFHPATQDTLRDNRVGATTKTSTGVKMKWLEDYQLSRIAPPNINPDYASFFVRVLPESSQESDPKKDNFTHYGDKRLDHRLQTPFILRNNYAVESLPEVEISAPRDR